MIKPNNCSKCPAYWCHKGLDDSDEGCSLCREQFDYEECRWPKWFIKFKLWLEDRRLEKWYKENRPDPDDEMTNEYMRSGY